MTLVLLGFFLLIVITSSGCIFLERETQRSMCLIGCIAFSVLLGKLGTEVQYSRKPQALDVYRGSTTLQVTYQDSIAVDSIVVYKKK